MHILVTRPQPAADRTAARLRGMGHAVTVAPLLLPRALPWALPGGSWDAVAFTSAMAPALAGDIGDLARLPAYAVGEATAAAARAAGFAEVRAVRGDASAVFARAAGDGCARLLHLAGRDRSDAVIPAGLQVDIVPVYAAELADSLPGGAFDLVLLYSTRTAKRFATLFDGDRAQVRLAVLSPQVAAAAGTGWAGIAVASEPTEDALFEAAQLSCDKPVQD